MTDGISVLRVETWSKTDFIKWILGVDPNFSVYEKIFQQAPLNPTDLLHLTSSDLKHLGITKVGHQITIEESLGQLRKIQPEEVEAECLQSFLSEIELTAGRFWRDLKSRSQPYLTELKRTRHGAPSDLLHHIIEMNVALKELAKWLVMNPMLFLTEQLFDQDFLSQITNETTKANLDFHKSLLQTAHSLLTTGQQLTGYLMHSRSRDSDGPSSLVRDRQQLIDWARHVEAASQEFRLGSLDYRLLEPCRLVEVQAPKKLNERLKIDIRSTKRGQTGSTHLVETIGADSPLIASKLSPGDQLLAVNRRPVVGWTSKSLTGYLDDVAKYSTDVVLVVKKPPLSVDGSSDDGRAGGRNHHDHKAESRFANKLDNRLSLIDQPVSSVIGGDGFHLPGYSLPRRNRNDGKEVGDADLRLLSRFYEKNVGLTTDRFRSMGRAGRQAPVDLHALVEDVTRLPLPKYDRSQTQSDKSTVSSSAASQRSSHEDSVESCSVATSESDVSRPATDNLDYEGLSVNQKSVSNLDLADVPVPYDLDQPVISHRKTRSCTATAGTGKNQLNNSSTTDNVSKESSVSVGSSNVFRPSLASDNPSEMDAVEQRELRRVTSFSSQTSDPFLSPVSEVRSHDEDAANNQEVSRFFATINDRTENGSQPLDESKEPSIFISTLDIPPTNSASRIHYKKSPNSGIKRRMRSYSKSPVQELADSDDSGSPSHSHRQRSNTTPEKELRQHLSSTLDRVRKLAHLKRPSRPTKKTAKPRRQEPRAGSVPTLPSPVKEDQPVVTVSMHSPTSVVVNYDTEDRHDQLEFGSQEDLANLLKAANSARIGRWHSLKDYGRVDGGGGDGGGGGGGGGDGPLVAVNPLFSDDESVESGQHVPLKKKWDQLQDKISRRLRRKKSSNQDDGQDDVASSYSADLDELNKLGRLIVDISTGRLGVETVSQAYVELLQFERCSFSEPVQSDGGDDGGGGGGDDDDGHADRGDDDSFGAG